MEYQSLTQLLSSSRADRSYFMSLPVELQLELHKRDKSISTAVELRQAVESINRGNRYKANENVPHEYSLY